MRNCCAGYVIRRQCEAPAIRCILVSDDSAERWWELVDGKWESTPIDGIHDLQIWFCDEHYASPRVRMFYERVWKKVDY